MKSKTYITASIILLLLAAGAFLGWSRLKGIGPALKKPPADITQIIENSAKQGSNGLASLNGASLTLPDGFRISIFAKNLDGPRVMQFDPNGNLIVTLTSRGQIVAIPTSNGVAPSGGPAVIGENMNKPHGLAFGTLLNRYVLYVAESHQVSMYDYDMDSMKISNKKKIADLPSGSGHSTRSLLFMPGSPQGKLLISVGSSCNVCNERNDSRASILVINADGSELKKYASGLRNSVFMETHPITGKIYATEMGRDYLGDDMPPDEINIIEEGKNYGWPVCYGKNVHDGVFDSGAETDPCVEPDKTPSFIDVPAHSAPLGLAFLSGGGWPNEYQNNLLVAYHGSWNRSVPTGYKIMRYKMDAQGNYLGVEDFISGWLTSDGALGRPVGIVAKTDGTIYISDDHAGVIYRVEYTR